MARGYDKLSSDTLESDALESETLEPYPSAGRWSRWKSLSSLLIVSVGSIGLLLLIGLGIGLHRSKSSGPLPPEKFFPNVPIKYTEFQYDDEFMRSDSIGDQAWESMLPLGAGYLKVPFPRRYSMKPSILMEPDNGDHAEMYQASVVHQLHCLTVLRFSAIHHNEDGEQFEQGHLLHCLNLIRQAILCSGDITLAHGSLRKERDGSFAKKFEGEGTVHKCRDWEFTKQLLVEHQFTGYNGSLLTT